MTKNQTPKDPVMKAESKPGIDALRLATFAGIVALVTISFMIWRSIDQIQVGLDGRLSRIEKQLENVGSNRGNAAANAAPRRGPDPGRVYTINTAGAPVLGPAIAAITIAEFSDFQ